MSATLRRTARADFVVEVVAVIDAVAQVSHIPQTPTVAAAAKLALYNVKPTHLDYVTRHSACVYLYVNNNNNNNKKKKKKKKKNTGEVRETSFLFQRCSVLVQRFNSILRHDSLPAYDCTDWFFVPIFVYFQ